MLHSDFPAPYPAGADQPPALRGQFAVYPIRATDRRAITYARHQFYKIGLYCSGQLRLRYGGAILAPATPCLVLFNALLPYTAEHEAGLVGYCCLFTAEFLGEARRGVIQESALFQLGSDPVFALDQEQLARLRQLFEQLLAEATEARPYQPELLRTYVQQLVLEALRLRNNQPVPVAPTSAAMRLTQQFWQLLEQQFPVVSPQAPLVLTTPAHYAERLHVHPNHLNRSVRQLTGQAVRVHLAARLAQEARALLRFTDWPVAEVARGLGFATAASFHRFFQRQAGLSPTVFRQATLARI